MKPDAAPAPAPAPDDKKPDPKAGDPAKAAPAGAPEKYDAFKAPEGYTIDEKFAGEASAIFKSLGLNQAQAQTLVDMYSAKVVELADAPFKAFEAMRTGWRDSVVKDPTLGNGTDNLKPEVAATIARAIDTLPADVSKDFREALTFTGAGDNPAFIKAFYNLAQRLGEGSLVKGGGPSPGGQAKAGSAPSAAQALYPNLPSAS